MIKVGDLFLITLTNGYKAIGHFVFLDRKYGPFMQVFNGITNSKNLDMDNITSSGYMFPPIITGLKAAVRNGLWSIMGNKPIMDFEYPRFIRCHWNYRTGEVINWFLFDGVNSYKLGPVLPDEYKELEYLAVWSPFDVINRIETGDIPFPYGEMIKNNKFTPLPQNNEN